MFVVSNYIECILNLCIRESMLILIDLRIYDDPLEGVDESQKCISTGPYERFYGLKMLCKRIFLKNHCCGR